jgi:hypothetical protein
LAKSQSKVHTMLQPVIAVAGHAARSTLRYCAPGFQVMVGAAATYVAGATVVAAGYYSFKGVRTLGRKITGWRTREVFPSATPVTPSPPAAKPAKAAAPKPTIVPEPAPAT